MQIDTIKALFTYFSALVLLVGGLVFLYLTRLDAVADIRILVGGLMGSAVTFLFSSESATRATRAAAAATAAATVPPTTNGG